MTLSEKLLFQPIRVALFIEQKSIKPEKEGEEKVKKPRFPSILGPPRRLSRVDSTSGCFSRHTHTQSNKDTSAAALSCVWGKSVLVSVLLWFWTVSCVQWVKPWS